MHKKCNHYVHNILTHLHVHLNCPACLFAEKAEVVNILQERCSSYIMYYID